MLQSQNKYKDYSNSTLVKQPLILPVDINNTMKHVTLELENDENVNFIEGRLNKGMLTYILLATNQGKYIECGVTRK